MKATAYKTEELLFLNMKKEKIYAPKPRMRGGLSVYQIEKTLSAEEKLAIIDEMKDGVGSYLIAIIKKWEDEKENLPKDRFGKPKTVSEKAWIKRNDPREIIDVTYKIGSYWLFKTQYLELSSVCPLLDNRYDLEYTGKEIVHQWFHDLCQELYRSEQIYFKEHDPFQKKLTKVKECVSIFSTVFDNQNINDIAYNGKTDVTEEELDQYIEAYDELDKKIKEITVKLNK